MYWYQVLCYSAASKPSQNQFEYKNLVYFLTMNLPHLPTKKIKGKYINLYLLNIRNTSLQCLKFRLLSIFVDINLQLRTYFYCHQYSTYTTNVIQPYKTQYYNPINTLLYLMVSCSSLHKFFISHKPGCVIVKFSHDVTKWRELRPRSVTVTYRFCNEYNP